MAVAAGWTHGAFMDIIRLVAADAGIGKFLLGQRSGMAGRALGRGMLAAQDEPGAGMVKACLFPVGGIVAACTIGTQSGFMGIILAVAGHAGRRRIAEFRRFDMACRADHGFVRTGQIEIGLFVFECLDIELDDPCRAAFMIGVAGFALLLSCLAVKALPCADIGGDILMTASAQGALRRFLEGLMAGRTGRFRFGMCGDDFTRHQYLLEIAGHRRRAACQQDNGEQRISEVNQAHQYRCTAMMCAITLNTMMKTKGRCSTCQSENRRSSGRNCAERWTARM